MFKYSDTIFFKFKFHNTFYNVRFWLNYRNQFKLKKYDV